MKVYFIASLVLAAAWVQADVTVSIFNQGVAESDGVGNSQTFSYQSSKVKADLLQHRFAVQGNRDFSFYKVYTDYTYTRLEWEPQQFELENYGLGLTVGEINNGKGRWSYLANIHTALRQQRGLSADISDMRTIGFVFGTYQVKKPWWGESLSWSVGLAYLDLEDGESVIPIAAFKWKLNEDWLLESKSTTINSHYSLNNSWTWKSMIGRKNEVWDVDQGGELRWATFQIGTGMTYKVSGKMTVEFLTGVNMGGEAQIKEAGALNRARDVDSGVWATASLKYNY